MRGCEAPTYRHFAGRARTPFKWAAVVLRVQADNLSGRRRQFAELEFGHWIG
jgi:hypothetical protein